MIDINTIKNDKYLSKIINDNNLSDSFISENLSVFKRVLLSRGLCNGCTNISQCRQAKKGERLSLSYDQVLIEEIERCEYGSSVYSLKELSQAYLYCDIPANLMDLDMDNITPKDNQRQLFNELFDIYEGKRNKGLFISGELGTGKSYNCTALANSLVKKGKRVAYVKASSFFNDLKSLYSNTNEGIDSTINKIKHADYLFLDDLGSEAVSEFVRDDILFRVLDYRMENKKTTIFISNYTKDGLFKHYQYDRKDNANTMNAKRLMERINILSDDYILTGKNLREVYNA